MILAAALAAQRALWTTICLLALGVGLSPHSGAASYCRQVHGSRFLDAVADRDIVLVKEMLAAGADPNTESGRYSALGLTIWSVSTHCRDYGPNPELFRLLVSAGADIRRPQPPNGLSLLDVASFYKASEIVQLLLEAGAKVGAVDSHGRPALQNASAVGDAHSVERLLKAGANPNARDSQGRTALHDAARNPGPENRTVKALVAAGAKYSSAGGYGGPFADLAKFNKGKTDLDELIGLLERAGGDINEQPRSQEPIKAPAPPMNSPATWAPATPLNVGLRSMQCEGAVIEAMLRHGADPNRGALYALMGRRDFDNIPLKRKHLLEMLFKHGARVELTPRIGSLGLLEAAEGHPEYARELQGVAAKYR